VPLAAPTPNAPAMQVKTPDPALIKRQQDYVNALQEQGDLLRAMSPPDRTAAVYALKREYLGDGGK
jgi:hypothetical protein